ncbi:MAG: ATP-grasp domain-containing protein, partial [Actinomycetes bacterium]
IQRHLGRTGRVIVRGSCGAAGSSAFVVGAGGEDVDGLLRRLTRRVDNRLYLVEAMVPATVSPNVQLHIAPDGGSITCVGVTDQRWERALVHGGNLYPSRARTVESMLEWACRMARWLQREGYAGLLGLDFVEYRDPRSGEHRAFLAEVNPRVNGATYPLAVLERLNAVQRSAGRPESRAFVSGSVEIRSPTFAAFRRAAEPLLYSPVTGRGVMPYTIGALAHGRCGVVVLGASHDEVLRAYGEFQTWCRREAR